MGELESGVTSVKELFSPASKNILEIPAYQRPFIWNREQAAGLLDGIFAHASPEEPYFIGTTILNQPSASENRFIVDGQQRISTITVALYALLDILRLIHQHTEIDTGKTAYTVTLQPGTTQQTSLDILRGQIQATLVDDYQKKRVKFKQSDEKRMNWISSSYDEKKNNFDPFLLSTKSPKQAFKLSKDLNKQGPTNAALIDAYYAVWMWVCFDEEFPMLIEKYERDADGKIKLDQNGMKIRSTRTWKAKDCEEYIFAEKLQPSLQRMADLTIKLLLHTKLIFLSVDSLQQAHLIFDKMNTTGTDLTVFDIIKGKAFSSKENMGGSWGKDHERQFMEHFNQVDKINPERSTLKQWSRHHAIAYYPGTPPANERELIKTITKDIESVTGPEELLKKVNLVCRSICVYHNEIKNPDEGNRIKSFNSSKQIKDMNSAGFTQHYPLLLRAILEEFSDSETSNLLTQIARTYISVLVIHGKSGNAMTNWIAEAAPLVQKDDTTKCVMSLKSSTEKSDFWKNLADGKTYTKESFAKDLADADSISAKVAGWLLRHIVRTGQPGSWDFESAVELQVEHILPQDPKKWGEPWYIKNETTDLHSECYQRLGNLTLLLAKDNVSVSNKPFSNKKALYLKSSQFETTKDVGNLASWGKAEIDTRSTALANAIGDSLFD